ncbi:exopolyphosphatase-like protein [Aulographum hederae CBS 113979]|uniref:Exopolyphosphatase-like protein n=1 Tax=Aulographum hederae CBS 113979 TaxID=1176131 RepID=A0A6G1H031_9PEZI|nr:exopolyphosphatase-like protein [Aulographum hederae CBS 113979]
MPHPYHSLRTFLTQAKSTLQSSIEHGKKVTFVIGNESADLDSLTSSILYAYIRSNSPPKRAFSPIYIPVLNIPYDDIKLRPEFLALLPYANLEPGHLITLNDLPRDLASKLPPENTKWILVDHNALQGRLGSTYSERIGGVIDHHDEENKVPRGTGEEPRVIDKSGSCTSLVVEYCREAWDQLGEESTPGAPATRSGTAGKDTPDVDAQVAQFALASILIDTTNLSYKLTDHDTTAAEYLESKIMASEQSTVVYKRDDYFAELTDAKGNIDGLTLYDILRKDYKEWETPTGKLGISSVVKNIDYFLQREKSDAGETKSNALLHTIGDYAEKKGLSIFSLMTTSTSAEGEFQRELFIWAFSKKTLPVAKEFAESAHDELGLDESHTFNDILDREGPKDGWRKVWWQRKVEHSRKQVAPLLRKAMD